MDSAYLSPDFFQRLKQGVQMSPHGFRYGYVDRVFRDDIYEQLVATFPDTNTFKVTDKMSGGGHKKFYVGPVYDCNKAWGSLLPLLQQIDPLWQTIAREFASPQFIQSIQEATGIPCNTLATFGFTYGNQGCEQGPHLDGAIRPGDTSQVHSTIASLLYFNPNPDPIGGTELYDTDRKTLIFRAPHLKNGLFFFEQHPDSWHGYPPLPAGSERHLVSLAFSQEPRAINTNESPLYAALPRTIRHFWATRP